MLEELLQGKGDIDGLAIALASLFQHHHGHKLDAFLQLVKDHPKYFVPLFLAVLALHPSVQTYVLSTMKNASSTQSRQKMDAFVMALRSIFDAVILDGLPLHIVQQRALALWMIS